MVENRERPYWEREMATTKNVKAKPGSSKAAAAKRDALFVEAYLSNGNNGKQAAITAGWSAASAGVVACEKLKQPNIAALIAERSKSVAEQAGLNTVGVLTELRKMVHADLRQLFNADGTLKEVSEWPDDVACAVSSLEIDQLFEGKGEERKQIGFTKKLKLWDKNAAVEKAMKHLGLFEKDNVQSKPSVTFTISGDDADL